MDPYEPLISLDTASEFLREVVPEWEWFVAHLESEDGRFRFPRRLAAIIQSLKIESYPLLYENEAAIGAVIARAFMDQAEFSDFDAQAREASPEERGAIAAEFGKLLEEVGEGFVLPKTPADARRAQEAFDALSEAERRESVRVWQCLTAGFLATFYQQLSVMVHGEKLTALVAQAKQGDRSAFAKAVQIDKRILSAIPYFKDRYALAGMQSDIEFLDEVGRRIAAPPYKGHIRHKSLWLTFAMLESCGLLTGMRHEALLDLCESVGVGGYKNRIEDVKNLSKRLAEYRRFQQRGIVSTP
jgi:hypothetical protein